MHARIGIAALVLAVASCGAHSRFALREPVRREPERPLSEAPRESEEENYANAADVILMRPVSHAFLFETPGEAHNVNSLDEVPESRWFTSRAVDPSDMERGPCTDDGPVLPFTIRSSKASGTTVGFVAEDAAGQRYMVKLAPLAAQPEVSQAADAIVSRLYWAIGFNAPCNRVLYVQPSELRLEERSVERLARGERRPLTRERLAELIADQRRGEDGSLRVSASRFIDGEPVGTWRTEGQRADDPNDTIPHEDRRELRAERFLAAWVGHWDSRGPNSYDAFVEASGGGYVVHYFLDFSDSLGATPIRTRWPEPRMGFSTVSDLGAITTDMLSLGLVRRPWDEVAVDPRYPNLGYFDVEHFDPFGFAPQTPLVRWARADAADMAWMARRIAGLGLEHVRAAVRTGRLSDPAEEARLVEVLMGRREAILRASFARSSPLGSPEVVDRDLFCATDLGLETGLADDTAYALELRTGARLDRSASPRLERAGSRVCARLPSFAPAGAPDDASDRYATLEVVRTSAGARTVLRAHFYDLGPERGYVLAGIERP
jgi:hypothetical protein